MSDPLFEGVVKALLGGAFICQQTYPDYHDALQQKPFQEAVDQYLGRIGLRVESTARSEAFYVAHAQMGPAERGQARALFKEIKYELRPVIEFLLFVIQAEQRDMVLAPGDVISFGRVLSEVSERASVFERLRGFPLLGKEFMASEQRPKDMLNKLFKWVESSGYLQRLRDKEDYVVTGKMAYFNDVVAFLFEHEPIPNEEEERADTGALF